MSNVFGTKGGSEMEKAVLMFIDFSAASDVEIDWAVSLPSEVFSAEEVIGSATVAISVEQAKVAWDGSDEFGDLS